MTFLRLTAILAITLFVSTLQADWTLDNKASKLSFLSTKNSSKTEVHTFGEVSGGLSAEGQGELVINLASVETFIPIRNERMREFLFETAKFPEAKIALTVDAVALDALNPGEMTVFKVPASISLHGKKQGVDLQFVVIKLTGERLLVKDYEPLLIAATDFDLKQGLETLREIAKLENITDTVPVTFHLVFAKR